VLLNLVRRLEYLSICVAVGKQNDVPKYASGCYTLISIKRSTSTFSVKCYLKCWPEVGARSQTYGTGQRTISVALLGLVRRRCYTCVGLVGYEQLESADGSLFPAIDQTKTFSSQNTCSILRCSLRHTRVNKNQSA